MSNPLRDGFALALERFDEYKLAKYRGEGKSIKMVDAVNLCHPKSTEAITKLMKGTLKSFDTWETEMSKTNGDENLKKEAWSKLIKSKNRLFTCKITFINNQRVVNKHLNYWL